MDLPHVDHVLSYDAPVDMAKYVHRVGRTARAGRQGDAWTLVEKQEARYFRAMLERSARKGKVKKLAPLDDAERQRLEAPYEVRARDEARCAALLMTPRRLRWRNSPSTLRGTSAMHARCAGLLECIPLLTSRRTR